MSEYITDISHTNKLLMEICSIPLHWQINFHNDLEGQIQILNALEFLSEHDI